MLNEAAARSQPAADVGGESTGGIIAAYDKHRYKQNTSGILPFVAGQNALSNVTADTSLSLHAIITVRQNSFPARRSRTGFIT